MIVFHDVSIFDQVGRIILAYRTPLHKETISLDVKDLSEGLYFIILLDRRGRSNIKKFLKL